MRGTNLSPRPDGATRLLAGVTVIAGMFTPAGDGRVTNTLIAAGPGTPNQPDAHYDKIHLYDAFGFTESRTVAPRACAAVIENSVEDADPPNSTAAARSRRSIQWPETVWKMTRLPRSSVITAGRRRLSGEALK